MPTLVQNFRIQFCGYLRYASVHIIVSFAFKKVGENVKAVVVWLTPEGFTYALDSYITSTDVHGYSVYVLMDGVATLGCSNRTA